jgi:hypothetical protein
LWHTGFVVIEFIVVGLAALLIGAGGLIHASYGAALAGLGVAINASSIVGIAVLQIRGGDESHGLLKLRSSDYRAQLRRDYPDLDKQSVLIMVTVLVPFLLAIAMVLSRCAGSP